MDNSVETVNAAATAIITAESRVQQVTSPQRRRWGGWLSMYWCFGSQRQGKRINHAVVIPETEVPGAAPVAHENLIHTSTLALPFVAPPSSPASFLQSEPASAVQSPVGLFSLSALSANGYSPGGPASIFAIGPYAHETQLVSPPAFTTEPSTAPFTPPPESVHQTTPPSPEVPFAQLLMSSLDSNFKKGECNEFYSYQLYPGSPIGHLISPSSVCSGTSSPFPDLEFHSSISSSFPSFPISEPPKLLNAEDLAIRKTMPIQSSRKASLVLDGECTTDLVEDVNTTRNSGPLMNHRLSFELSAEEVARCLEEEPAPAVQAELESRVDATKSTADSLHQTDEAGNIIGCYVDETYHDLPEKLQLSTADRAAKEFKFDNADGTPEEPTIGSDWWANERVVSTENGSSKNWAFFPIKQPVVS